MQTFIVEVVSAMPAGAQYPHQKQYIQAANVNDALAQYKNIMQGQLPNGHRYGIEVTDQQGRKEVVVWDKR